jgi:hypothetical protein
VDTAAAAKTAKDSNRDLQHDIQLAHDFKKGLL